LAFYIYKALIYVSVFQTRADESIRIYSFPHTRAFICGSISAIISLILLIQNIFLFVIISSNNKIRTKKALFDIDILSLVLKINRNFYINVVIVDKNQLQYLF